MMIRVRYIDSRLSVTEEIVYVGDRSYPPGTDIEVIADAVKREGIAKDVSYVATNYDTYPGLVDSFKDEVDYPYLDSLLPVDSEARKNLPIMSGCLDYFPAALAEVARLSKYGNDKHNPGEELHHARGKSTDHADCIVRHLMERGKQDPSGFSHSVMVAWRSLALLQEELEAAGAPLARGARLDEDFGLGPEHQKWAEKQAEEYPVPGSAVHRYDGN